MRATDRATLAAYRLEPFDHTPVPGRGIDDPLCYLRIVQPRPGIYLLLECVGPGNPGAAVPESAEPVESRAPRGLAGLGRASLGPDLACLGLALLLVGSAVAGWYIVGWLLVQAVTLLGGRIG